ncbi:MAG: Npt1/Npt2 family nucleotide transporter [Chloroflexota bacterium]
MREHLLRWRGEPMIALGRALNKTPLAFGVRSGELQRVAILAVYSAAAVGGVLTVGSQGLATAVFVSRLPTEAMPFTLILPGASIVVMLLIYNRLLAHFELTRVATTSAVALVCIGLGLRLLLAAGYGTDMLVLGAVFLFCATAASLMTVQFWTIAGQVFNPREARRLFGPIAMGGTLSVVVAGLSLGALVKLVGLDNLLFVVVASLGICGVCAGALGRHVASSELGGERRTAYDLPEAGQASLLHDVREIVRSPLLRAIAGLAILLSLLINIGFYQYVLGLHALYAGRAEALAVFLGSFALWTGLAGLTMQLLVTSRVMTHWGMFVALLLFPLATAVGATLGLLSGGALWALAVTRAADPVVRRTINESALNALYLPVPPAVRRQVTTVLEGVYALTFTVAGVCFLFVQRDPNWTYERWSLPLLVLCLCWIAHVVWGRRQYARAVADGLKRRRLSFDGVTLDVTDENTVRLLANALRSADDARVVHVLELLRDAPRGAWSRHVLPLLSHASPEIRILALSTLERDRDPEHVDSIVPLLDAPEPAVRAAAVLAYASLHESSADTRIPHMLNDPSPQVKAAAIVGLLAHAEARWHFRAAEECERMLGSDDPRTRREAAWVLDAIRAYEVEPRILSFLNAEGDAFGTRRECDEVIIRHLVRLLEDSACAGAAAEGLVHYGDSSLPALAETLGNPTMSRSVRLRVVRIIQRIGGGAVSALLLRQLGDPDGAVRGAVCRALAHLRTSGQSGPIDEAALLSTILAELHEMYALYVARADLANDTGALIETALIERTTGTLDRILLLLEACFSNKGLAHARLALSVPGSVGPALAIELLDTVVDDRVTRLLIPFLEGTPNEIIALGQVQLGIARQTSPKRLEQFAAGADAWLQACALHEVGRRRLSQLSPVVVSALSAQNPVVCEAAMAACCELLDQAQVVRLAQEQASHGRFPLLRRYAWSRSQQFQAASAVHR